MSDWKPITPAEVEILREAGCKDDPTHYNVNHVGQDFLIFRHLRCHNDEIIVRLEDIQNATKNKSYPAHARGRPSVRPARVRQEDPGRDDDQLQLC